jgi:hypothetical protein
VRPIHGRNVHQILPSALRLLRNEGVLRSSRFGDVLQLPDTVATVYEQPWERVLFWPERDANPFFHLYECLWLLAGRNDLATLTRYVKTFGQFSDDGHTLRGAYGKRWRNYFSKDQLAIIANSLIANKNDRRCVVQMWDTDKDLGEDKKDLPCNTIATFQVNTDGLLELVVFCRSNDIVWGAYGANAVHFSFLHEYMAAATGLPMGRYTQISVNWHGYVKTLEPVWPLEERAFEDGTVSIGTNSVVNLRDPNPYDTVRALRMPPMPLAQLDEAVRFIVDDINALYEKDEPTRKVLPKFLENQPFWNVIGRVLEAHFWYRARGAKFAIAFLDGFQAFDDFDNVDWVVAAREWLERRVK